MPLLLQGWAVLVAILFQVATVYAQPSVHWAAAAGGPGLDLPRDIALTPGGEILIAGRFDYEDVTQPETVLHRFGQNGEPIASQASRGEEIRSVTVDASGNYYVTGRVWDPGRLGTGVLNDFYLAKYSSTGTLLWERATGSTGSPRRFAFDGGFKVAIDAKGDICVAGLSSGPALFGSVTFPDTPGGPLICKYTPDGTLLWVKRVEATGEIFMETQLGTGSLDGMAVDSDGNIVIHGYMRDGPADFGGTVVNIPGPYGSVYIAKLNPAGELRWARTGVGGGGIAIDGKGNTYFNGGQDDPRVMRCGKFSPVGDLVWQRNIPGGYGGSVGLDAKDEPVFAAEFEGPTALDGFTVNTGTLMCKADANGAFQWVIGQTGDLRVGVGPMASDRLGNLYVVGHLNCRYVDGEWICGASELGSFTLTPRFAGGTSDFFVARLFDPTAVTVELKIAKVGSDIGLSWPVEATNYVLEVTTSLPAASWTAVTSTPVVSATRRSVQLPVTGTASFFRLRQR